MQYETEPTPKCLHTIQGFLLNYYFLFWREKIFETFSVSFIFFFFSGTQISQLPLRLPWWTRMLVHPQSSGQRKNYLSGNFRFRHGT